MNKITTIIFSRITFLAFLFILNKACNSVVCCDCEESNCIYQEINNAAKCETDECIQDAVKEVCNRRNITDSATIQNILSNYYL